ATAAPDRSRDVKAFPLAPGDLPAARALVERGEYADARAAYLRLLAHDPTHFAVLNEFATLAQATGYRSAALTAMRQAVAHHPDEPIGHVNLANLLLEDGDALAAKAHCAEALRLSPGFAPAHQAMARALDELGDPAAEAHRDAGFTGHATVVRAFRGRGAAIPILLLVSARQGNIATAAWFDDRVHAVTAIYTEYWDAGPLPTHRLVVNAVGDADLSGRALARAADICARTPAPVINPPARVVATGRAGNATRLACISGCRIPAVATLPADTLRSARDLAFPLLVRRPGFHTGRHFRLVETAASLDPCLATLGVAGTDDVLVISYLDARGADGMARKYRVMFIDGQLYPVHLAISADWKVHYFTAAMADAPQHRAEEQRFLADMPAVVGPKAMAALTAIRDDLQLDYGGVDFGLGADGELLFFEANATMVLIPPDPDPIWDYRRPAIAAARQAVARMLARRLEAR
ncbi:MAG: hypothetical protein P4L82_02940, partial [Ancalomicrobiaceae bacterium]|nr:hypothetical protein [Ancalomicrobiaceae bacterium]